MLTYHISHKIFFSAAFSVLFVGVLGLMSAIIKVEDLALYPGAHHLSQDKKFSITNQDIGPFYNGHGDQITNKREISQLLLEQFSSVFSTPSNDKKVTNPDLFFLDNENETQLDDHIISAVNEMSAGPDGLPSSFLKECPPELIQPLKILFRKSLDSGDIPAILKRAAIIPVFKGGDKTCPSNCRPISLTPV